LFQTRGDPDERVTRILYQPIFHHGISRRAVAIRQSHARQTFPGPTRASLRQRKET
jgi:hypothetical protein